jgi:hypothetical protein
MATVKLTHPHLLSTGHVRHSCASKLVKTRTWADGHGRLHSDRAESAIPLFMRIPPTQAAGVGFEPTARFWPGSGFQDRPIRPLWHPAHR